ncbi:hypothetical protein HNY73_017484 [Argiope bruennichi]|uniref:Uncharacterized protein n=1 Tax=Argiope bruennichi TaxID=94029 RepID=A0A8T0EB23_ARGBR|nr:hypothetical protein HNY73_017484 [Argiope bruennichi]
MPVCIATDFPLDKNMDGSCLDGTRKFFSVSYRSNIGIDRLDNMTYIHAILLHKGTPLTTSSVAFCYFHTAVH